MNLVILKSHTVYNYDIDAIPHIVTYVFHITVFFTYTYITYERLIINIVFCRMEKESKYKAVPTEKHRDSSWERQGSEKNNLAMSE